MMKPLLIAQYSLIVRFKLKYIHMELVLLFNLKERRKKTKKIVLEYKLDFMLLLIGNHSKTLIQLG